MSRAATSASSTPASNWQARSAEWAAGRRSTACDVSDRASVDALIDQVERDLGTLDIVVSNAGTAGWQAFTRSPTRASTESSVST